MSLNLSLRRVQQTLPNVIIATKNNQRAAQSTVRQNKSGQQTGNQRNNNNNKGNSQNGGVGRRNGPLKLNTVQWTATNPLENFKVGAGTTPGGCRVRGQELIQTVSSGGTTLLYGADGTTSSGTISLSPTVFPRLTGIASTYEMYLFHKAEIFFQSNQPTTTQGVVMVAVDYDAKDVKPTSSITMMKNISSSMANVYSYLEVTVDRRLSRLNKYVVTEESLSDIDQTLQGKIYYAFEGVAATNAPMGYIVIRYDVEFFTPQ